jgi:SAM-dependent methyltransferase
VQNYVGYDISENMLLEFKTKWPQYRSQKDETANRLYHMSFLDDHLPFSGKFDLVLSLNAGLNCLARPNIKKAIENLWSCVKKGGTLLVMTYGTLKPEERETSVHKLIKVDTYPYTMVEGPVLWTWTRNLANSEDPRIYPFSKPDKEGLVREKEDMSKEDLRSYHINRIQEEIEKSLINYNPRIGGPENSDCSYYLTVVKKL